ncbi:uncharacterized protein DS421_11g335510 [Arachis hypogaea]|nr:uncharacterized protein DS421_11g335510 [Arachis hypogaea]
MPRLVAQVARLSEVESVPHHVVQVARSWICELFKFGVPRLGSQVARPSDFLELACHAFDIKWHAIVEVLLGMVSWRATPLCSSGMPIVVDGSGVPCPTWRAMPLLCPPFCSLEFCTSVPRPVPGVPLPYACLDFFSRL